MHHSDAIADFKRCHEVSSKSLRPTKVSSIEFYMNICLKSANMTAFIFNYHYRHQPSIGPALVQCGEIV